MHPLIILFGLLLPLQMTTSWTQDTISAGEQLVGNDRLVSSNGKFALGFFQPGNRSSLNASNWYLGIWFNKVSKFTTAWVANGDRPVAGSTSPALMISSDGNLVILDQATKFIIWTSQANTTSDSTTAVLLNTGNLVLQNTSNSSHILWQSFDHPTDTHLAGAKLGTDKITGLNRRLVSRKNSADPASGMYSYELLDNNGSARFILAALNSSIPYWSSGEWNGHFFGSIPQMSAGWLINFTYVNNEEEQSFTYTIHDDTMIIRFALDIFGQTSIFLWVEGSNDWVPSYTNPKQCDVYGICGPFSICEESKLPFCNCMKGFSVRSPYDWELDDRTGGWTELQNRKESRMILEAQHYIRQLSLHTKTG